MTTTHQSPEREGKYKKGDKVYLELKVLGSSLPDGKNRVIHAISKEMETYFLSESELQPLAEDLSPSGEKDEILISGRKINMPMEEAGILIDSFKPTGYAKDTAPEEWEERLKLAENHLIAKIVDYAGQFQGKPDATDFLRAIKSFKHQVREEERERAVEIVEKLKVNLSGTEFQCFGEELNVDIDEAITAIRANRSERRKE